jgi:hypothetical protein
LTGFACAAASLDLNQCVSIARMAITTVNPLRPMPADIGGPQSNGADVMKKRLLTLAAAALFAMTIAPGANVASASPAANAFAIKDAAPTNIETVRWRGRGWHRGGGGAGVAAGVLGGLILGGMLAAPYGPGPYYYGPGPYYGPGYYGGDAVGYCLRRYRSYDPRSGTYLGYDGYRHPCP